MNKYQCLFIVTVLLNAVSYNLYSQAADEDFILKHKCGTFQKKELLDNLKFDRIQEVGDTNLPCRVLSNSGRFMIHYDTLGINAVSMIDDNKNGIPDYIDSVMYYCDYVYHREVEEFGYISPIRKTDSNTIIPYNIYIGDIGNGVLTYYGFTDMEDQVLPPGKFPRYNSHITIDNNYSTSDSTIDGTKTFRTYPLDTGITIMKTTLAHEFHHAIQFYYGENSFLTALNEMTSVLMEYRVFPEVKDYYQFVRILFKHYWQYPFGDGMNPYSGYCHSIFGQYLYHTYGDTVVKRMWELIGNPGMFGYQALDSSLREQGTTLLDAIQSYEPWIYYNGERALPGKYFPQAAEFPNLTPYDSTILGINDDIDLGDDTGTDIFEMRPYRFFLKPGNITCTYDTLDVFLQNMDLEFAYSQNIRLVPYTLLLKYGSGVDLTRIDETEYYYGTVFPIGLLSDFLFFKGKICTDISDYAFPSPYRYGIDNSLFFPVPENAPLNTPEKISLKIYTIEMTEVYSDKLPAEVVTKDKITGRWVVRLNSLPPDMSSGVYIFTTSYKDNEKLGKFTVKR